MDKMTKTYLQWCSFYNTSSITWNNTLIGIKEGNVVKLSMLVYSLYLHEH